jgi:hypothetical protein
METQVFANIELHAIDFREEAGHCSVIISRIAFHLAEMSNLLLQRTDPVKGDFQFLIVVNHDLFRSDFYDATFCAITFDLPLFNSRILTAESSQAAQPEDAGSKMILCGRMIEKQSKFADNATVIEIIVHHHENVHVVGLRLVRNERAEHHKPCEVASLRRQSIDAFEPAREDFSPGS